MSNRAIMKFGEMLTKSKDIRTTGSGGPIFAWAAPGDIVICGEAPEDFDGRVCSVKLPDEETSLLCRLYRDGENVRVGFMDDYDIWKSYPADVVTIRYEVLAVVHQYGRWIHPRLKPHGRGGYSRLSGRLWKSSALRTMPSSYGITRTGVRMKH